MPPFPEATCCSACAVGLPPDRWDELPAGVLRDPGLVWATEGDLLALSPDPATLSWVLGLRLADPDAAAGFRDAHPQVDLGSPGLQTWQEIRDEATEAAADAQVVLVAGAWLLGLLATASVSVLVVGRMADQTRRVGLLKAVGATPGLVAAVLLAEYALVALVAGLVGTALGTVLAPQLTEVNVGLLGSTGTPPVTATTVGPVLALALAVAVAATVRPALRAARISTVDTLADRPRSSGGATWLIAVSSALPVPLLLAVRMVARRPRRAVLAGLSVAVSVSGTVVALVLDAELGRRRANGLYRAGQAELLADVLFLVMVMVLVLAAVNAVFTAWVTVLDNRHRSALTRGLGATPAQVGAALAAAQVLPTVVGALLGVFPGSLILFALINGMNDNGNDARLPALWQLAAVVVGAVALMAGLTAVPALLGARRPVGPVLRSELI